MARRPARSLGLLSSDVVAEHTCGFLSLRDVLSILSLRGGVQAVLESSCVGSEPADCIASTWARGLRTIDLTSTGEVDAAVLAQELRRICTHERNVLSGPTGNAHSVTAFGSTRFERADLTEGSITRASWIISPRMRTVAQPPAGWLGVLGLLPRLSVLAGLRSVSMPRAVLTQGQLRALEAIPLLDSLDVTQSVLPTPFKAGRPACASTLRILRCSGSPLLRAWQAAGARFTALTDVTCRLFDAAELDFLGPCIGGGAGSGGTASASGTAAARAAGSSGSGTLQRLHLVRTRLCPLRAEPALWRGVLACLRALTLEECDLAPRPHREARDAEPLADTLAHAPQLRELRLRRIRAPSALAASPHYWREAAEAAAWAPGRSAPLELLEVAECGRLSPAVLEPALHLLGPHLRVLDCGADNGRMTDSLLALVGRCCGSLQRLRVAFAPQITDAALAALAAAPCARTLAALDISGSGVRCGSTLAALAASCPSLRELRMWGLHAAVRQLALAEAEAASPAAAAGGAAAGGAERGAAARVDTATHEYSAAEAGAARGAAAAAAASACETTTGAAASSACAAIAGEAPAASAACSVELADGRAVVARAFLAARRFGSGSGSGTGASDYRRTPVSGGWSSGSASSGWGEAPTQVGHYGGRSGPDAHAVAVWYAGSVEVPRAAAATQPRSAAPRAAAPQHRTDGTGGRKTFPQCAFSTCAGTAAADAATDSTVSQASVATTMPNPEAEAARGASCSVAATAPTTSGSEAEAPPAASGSGGVLSTCALQPHVTAPCPACGAPVRDTDACDHAEVCPAALLRCPCAGQGCVFTGPRAAVGNHLPRCPRWLLRCPVLHCGGWVRRAELEAHLAAHIGRTEQLAIEASLRCPQALAGCEFVQAAAPWRPEAARAGGRADAACRSGRTGGEDSVCTAAWRPASARAAGAAGGSPAAAKHAGESAAAAMPAASTGKHAADAGETDGAGSRAAHRLTAEGAADHRPAAAAIGAHLSSGGCAHALYICLSCGADAGARPTASCGTLQCAARGVIRCALPLIHPPLLPPECDASTSAAAPGRGSAAPQPRRDWQPRSIEALRDSVRWPQQRPLREGDASAPRKSGSSPRAEVAGAGVEGADARAAGDTGSAAAVSVHEAGGGGSVAGTSAPASHDGAGSATTAVGITRLRDPDRYYFGRPDHGYAVPAALVRHCAAIAAAGGGGATPSSGDMMRARCSSPGADSLTEAAERTACGKNAEADETGTAPAEGEGTARPAGPGSDCRGSVADSGTYPQPNKTDPVSGFLPRELRAAEAAIALACEWYVMPGP